MAGTPVIGWSRSIRRILFISGYPDDAVRPLDDDGIPLLPKPFGSAALARAVRAALDGRSTT